jgi:hypothetical protein
VALATPVRENATAPVAFSLTRWPKAAGVRGGVGLDDVADRAEQGEKKAVVTGI